MQAIQSKTEQKELQQEYKMELFSKKKEAKCSKVLVYLLRMPF